MMTVVLSAPLLTIQDSGRQGLRHLGIPRCGMMDTLALRQGNILLGNDENAAALEITSGPVVLRFDQRCTIVLMGADMQAEIQDSNQKSTRLCPLIPGFVYAIEAGGHLRLNHAQSPGQRAMLMVSGGFDVPLVMGSRSTDLMNGFGGLDGQALRAGDSVAVFESNVLIQESEGIRQQAWSHTLRVIPGPDFKRFDERAHSALLETGWIVSPQSNRMGLRLHGEALRQKTGTGNDSRLFSIGVLPGVIQVPPDGQPIVLAADAQTTGGYAAIASIISSDLWQLAYLNAGSVIRFAEVSLAEAHGITSHQLLQLNRLRDQLSDRNNQVTT